jgi:hypothetical protein
MEAQPALRWSARDIVLHAVALEDLYRPVIPLDREMDRELALGNPQHGTKTWIQREVVGRSVELGERRS